MPICAYLSLVVFIVRPKVDVLLNDFRNIMGQIPLQAT